MLPYPILTPLIAFTFDPIATVGDWNVRWETLAYAAVMFLALVAAVVIARRTPLDPARPVTALDEEGDPNRLRADDLLYIAVAVIPGAVVGGRLGYVLTHLDFYVNAPAAIVDIGQGAFELTLAVVGGTLTGAVVARMLGAPVGRWLHAAILPLLFALGAGKLAMVLGGSGQGLPFDGTWATAYLSPGPWGSLAPELPSHPSQVYESITTLLALLVVMWAMALDVFGRRNGGAFLLGIGLWGIGRVIAATTWRDPAVLASLGADQVLTLVVAAGALVALVAVGGVGARRRRRERRAAQEAPETVAAT